MRPYHGHTGRHPLRQAGRASWDPGQKVMFDAFGLPIFDLSVAKEAFVRAGQMGLGTSLTW